MKKYIFSIVCACIVLITTVSCQKTNGKVTGNTTKTAANGVSKNNIAFLLGRPTFLKALL